MLAHHCTAFLAPASIRAVAPGGYLGVDLFFVLSGYLITSIVLDDHARRPHGWYRRFLVRRALRLLPAVLFLLVVHAVVATVRSEPAVDVWATTWPVLLYVANWAIEAGWQVSPYLGHMWSLAVEEQFYLVWPLTIVALTALAGRRRVVLIGGVLGACALVALWRADQFAAHDELWLLVYTRTDVRADGLLMGAAVALVGAGPLGRRLPKGTAWLALLVFVGAVLTVDRESSGLYRGGFSAVALACAVIVAATAAGRWRATGLLGSAPLVAIGKRSYSLYLWHFPVLVLVQTYEPFAWRLLAGLGLTFAAAEVSYRYVEQPFLRLKDRFAAEPREARPALSS